MCEIVFDGDSPKVWQESQHKARKKYGCNTCGCDINPGDQYGKVFLVNDQGDAFTERACHLCDIDRIEFGAAHGCNFTPFSFPDYLYECARDGGENDEKWEAMIERIEARRELAKEPTDG